MPRVPPVTSTETRRRRRAHVALPATPAPAKASAFGDAAHGEGRVDLGRSAPTGRGPARSRGRRAMPAARAARTQSMNRTGLVTWATRLRRISAGSRVAAPVTLLHTGKLGRCAPRRRERRSRGARAPGAISGEWNAPATSSRIGPRGRRAPSRPPRRRRASGRSPLITTWPGAFRFATTHTPRVATRALRARLGGDRLSQRSALMPEGTARARLLHAEAALAHERSARPRARAPRPPTAP